MPTDDALTHPDATRSPAPAEAAAPPVQDASTYARRFIGLSLLWAVLVFLGDRAGVAPLPVGSGVVLVTGMTLSASLFLLLGRLPPAEQPPLPPLVAVQSLVAIVWATLYGYFAAAPTGAEASVALANAMTIAALLLAMPVASRQHLTGLAVAGVAGAAGTLVLRMGLTDAPPGAFELLCLAALCAVTALILVTATQIAASRDWQRQRYEDLRLVYDRQARRSQRDDLTNTYTRRFILEMLGREKARSDRTGNAFCVLLLDIDHFKALSDRFGPVAGDRILASFARRVRTELRDMDTVNRNGPAQASLGRMGGEEFIVVLPHTSLRGALKAAERIRRGVLRQLSDGAEPVTVSVGIAEYRAAESVSDLLVRADQALYSARKSGRNRVHCATTDGGGSAVVMPEIPKAS